jgi:hypothetical protein
MPESQHTPHQVFLADQHLIDEQYFFEDADDARWFWGPGVQVALDPGQGRKNGDQKMRRIAAY